MRGVVRAGRLGDLVRASGIFCARVKPFTPDRPGSALNPLALA